MTDGTIYHKHMTQRVPSDPFWNVNCAAYAAAMAINDSVLGGLKNITGKRIRAMSSEPIPDPASPGLNIGQLVSVAKLLGVPLYQKDETWDVLRAQVGNGASRVILPVWYDAIDPYGCQQQGTFGHALLLVRVHDGKVRLSDPLCDVTKEYPESVVRHAAEVFAGGPTITYAVTRVVPKWVP